MPTTSPKKLKKPTKKTIKKPIKNISLNLKKDQKHTVNSKGKRVRSVTKHNSFRLSPKVIKQVQPLPNIKSLFKDPIKLIFNNKKTFFSLTLIYATLNFVFIKGFGSNFDLMQTRQQLIDYFGNDAKSWSTSTALFQHLVSGGSSSSSSSYQFFILIVFILALVWLCRELFAGNKPKIKDAFYKGMYPLIPFLLVLFVISLQMLPMTIGGFLFGTVLANGLAVTTLEKTLWFIVFIVLVLLSIYMLISSFFGLIISTLHDVTPMQALRSARDIVLHRRLGITARIVSLLIVEMLLITGIFLPIVIIIPFVAELLFLIFSSFLIVVNVVYIYNFYRKLL